MTGVQTQDTIAVSTDGHDPSVPVDELSLPKLLVTLSDQTTTLVRQEVELAKAELTVKARRLGVGAGFFGGSGLLATMGLATLVACAVAALSLVIPVWAAALCLAVALFSVAGAVALVGGVELKRGTPPLPEQAIESTKEDVAWFKTQARSAKP